MGLNHFNVVAYQISGLFRKFVLSWVNVIHTPFLKLTLWPILVLQSADKFRAFLFTYQSKKSLQ